MEVEPKPDVSFNTLYKMYIYKFLKILYYRCIESEVGLLKKMFVTPPAIFFLYKKRFYLHSTMKS